MRLLSFSYHLTAVFCFLFCVSLCGAQGPAQPFLRRPDIHGDRVVFTCEGDLWLGSLTTQSAERITSHNGVESNARFSPDGKMLAFSAQYEGSSDVYVLPIEGGEPRRLTYDPNGAQVVGWTPDGKNVLFRAFRPNPLRGNHLFSVPAAGGMPQMLPIPQADHAAMNSDGHRIAYVPVSAEWQHWFHYQGGEADDIWLTDTAAHTFRRLTDHIGVDTSPAWIGNALYFISERDGLANLYRLDPDSRKVTAVTRYADYEARYPASDGKRIVLQHGNGLALYDPALNKTQELTFALHSDRIHARARRLAAQPQLNTATLGPTGKRLLIEARGQIVSVPVEEGDYRPLGLLLGSRSQYPAWSPDGKQIAFVSDRSGEEQVWLCPTTGAGEARQLTRDHKGPLGKIVWSPDGKYVVTGDREMRILLVDTATGATTQVDQADRSGSYDTVNESYRFSPDGKWLTYAHTGPNWNSVIYLYEIASKKKVAITSPEMNSYGPAFDPAGKYLLFLSDRQFDPTGSASHFFALDKTAKVSMVTLAADTLSPFLPNNDEEGATAPKKQEEKADAVKAGEKPAVEALKPVRVDLEGIAERIIDVPVPAARYQKVEAVEGRLLLLTNEDNTGTSPNQLAAFDLKKKQSATLVNRLNDFEVSEDHKKLLLRTDKEFAVVDATTGAVAAGTGKVNLSAVMLNVDPQAEWKQIFSEAWRIGRDFFYDPAMHGIDWEAVKRKYAAQLPAIGSRDDLNEVLGNMIAELNAGHAYVGGGSVGETGVPGQRMGFLGADFEPVPGQNAYRLTRLYPGDGFELGARSPLLTPGVNIKTGDYILAVAGQPVRADQDLQALLIGTAGQIITLTVNSKPTREGSREIRIRPIGSESKARYYDWVASRSEYVRTHGGENLGYVHIPDMGDGGLQEFTKHYYPNSLIKDGIVYDVRNNGGGNISAMLLLQMSTKPYAWFKPRYGASWTRADWGFSGYSVALCNENSGSNAEEFCDAFQRLKLGPVIGTRTWGGEVGSGGGYRLLDGGTLFIPNYGEWSPDGKWLIEGTGAQPDITVEQDPAAVLAGRDPQLDRAIAYLKAELEKRPVVRPVPPPFPNKAYRPTKTARK